MATVQCNTCGGTYVQFLPDGTRYFHACPPIARATVTRAGSTLTVDETAIQPTDVVVARFAEPRKNARNENAPLPAPPAVPSTLPATPVASAGTGVTVVADVAPTTRTS